MAMMQGWGDVEEGDVGNCCPPWCSPVRGRFQGSQFQKQPQPRGPAELWCQPWLLALTRCDPAAQGGVWCFTSPWTLP